MKVSNLIKILGIMLAFAVVACGPSTEGEANKWKKAQKDAPNLKTEYPNFAAAIDTQMKAAETAMKATDAIKDDEKKAKAMQAANAIAATVGGNLTKIKAKIASLNSAMDKLGKLKIPKSKSGTRNRAFDTGNSAISNVRAALTAAKPANAGEAEVLLKAQLSELSSAESAVDRAHSSLKPKRKKKKKKKKRKKN